MFFRDQDFLFTMHDAWIAVALADAYLAQTRYKEANKALLDAESHYRKFQSALTAEKPDVILDQLTEDVRVRLDQIRVAIKINAGTLAKRASAGQ
jgi:hypothetical protein